MKTILKYIGLIIVSFLLTNCSSVRTVDVWKNKEPLNLKHKKVIVFSKTDDNIIRTLFENDIVDRLKQKGINPIESYTLFPIMDTSKELTKNEKKQFTQNLRSQGIDIVILTVLKDVQEYTETVTTGGGYSSYTHPVIYYSRFHKGFFVYYDTVYYKSEPIDHKTYNLKKYILETVVFDISKPEKEQLISLITTEIDNPNSLTTVSRDFSKKITNNLIE